ncbi:MAG: hypothetical protein A3C38_01275 [Planctomycetes bacterium RIFCSPHIGHO2_02_FULL_50_42]|nr:MAG: hypothetical protein A3C38_01275 [Planctomycetes bacterium RIFCSPHIGHO2_02_FULL_50_42]OHB92460.1 MAG: hypothetical protein A3E75_01685 [Planctomycetes bacterium RIFCSPHIGHO2_12_FULL_51_37]
MSQEIKNVKKKTIKMCAIKVKIAKKQSFCQIKERRNIIVFYYLWLTTDLGEIILDIWLFHKTK